MRSYDDIEGFINYTSEDEWRRYIESYVIPLWKYSWILKEYWEELRNEFDTLPFDEVKEEEKPLLLGGIVQRDEIYTRNSLAKFYTKFFGMRLKDIQSWILQSQTGEMLTEISVEVAETEFIKFVKEVFNLLDYGLLHQRLVTDFKEPQLDYEEFKSNPNKVKEAIKNFYQSLLNITLNYNYRTFFLCSINQITYHYMKAAYPKIDDILDFLMDEFGLTELKWNNPIKPESKTFRDYTIYCFPEYNPNNKGKSFGGAICALNERMWSVFSYSSELKNTLSILFGNVPNLKEEFRERIKSRLPERYYSWIYFKGISASERGYADAEAGSKTIMEMLDENSPFLFTNLIKIDYVTDTALNFASVG
ncbi:MAG TPA: hypothetical protein ENI49_05085 [Thermoplasmatales archaeon]|nr:hypothetical protein [Thermoplasmatales archaeon]